MARLFTCGFGNCESVKTPISLNVLGDVQGSLRLPERKRFCCEEHAAGYLIRCAWIMHPGGSVGEAALQNIEKAIRAAAPFRDYHNKPIEKAAK